MTSAHLFVTLILGLIVYAIYQINEIEVSPEDFAIEHRLRFEARSDRFLQFLVQEDSLEKLLPWLTRLKEADTKIVSAGKNYRAFLKLPIVGVERIELTVIEYRPGNLLIFESSDTTTRQRIKFRVRSYHNRTILRTTIHLRKTSAVYHYTFGLVVRRYMRRHLEKSSPMIAEIYRAVTKPLEIGKSEREPRTRSRNEKSQNFF